MVVVLKSVIVVVGVAGVLLVTISNAPSDYDLMPLGVFALCVWAWNLVEHFEDVRPRRH